MRKTLLLLFVSILFSGQLLAQDSRIVYSEDFEDATDVANWGAFVGATGYTTKAHNATGGVSGSGALELGDGGSGFLIERPITAIVDSEYLLTLDVKTLGWDNQATYPITISLIGIDANPATVYVNNSTGFTTITVGGTATSSTGHIRIQGLNTSIASNVWVDNITLVVNQSFAQATNYKESFDTSGDVGNWNHHPDSTNVFTVEGHNSTDGVLELTDGGSGFLTGREVTATIGEKYLLTLDVKTLGWSNQTVAPPKYDFPIYVSLVGIDTHPKVVLINDFTDFTKITLAGIASNSSGRIEIVAKSNVTATNKVWIDNISLKSIDMDAVVWDGSEWNSGSAPTMSNNAIVDGALTVSDDLAVKNIEVTSNGYTYRPIWCIFGHYGVCYRKCYYQEKYHWRCWI